MRDSCSFKSEIPMVLFGAFKHDSNYLTHHYDKSQNRSKWRVQDLTQGRPKFGRLYFKC